MDRYFSLIVSMNTVRLRHTFLKGICLLAALFIASQSHAQAPKFKFNRIGENEGLLALSVRCILQDTENYMWFGTDYGLNKYDGYNFTVYKNDPGNQASISNDIIVCLFEDSKKNLWVGTLDGLSRYDRERDKFVSYRADANNPKSLSANAVQSIYETRDGNLWISAFDPVTNKGSINLYDNHNGFIKFPQTFNAASGIGDNIINCFYEEKNGNLWLGLSSGLSYFDKVNNTFTTYNTDQATPQSINGPKVNSIIEDLEGNLWVGLDIGGLGVFNKKTKIFKHYTYNPNNPKGLASPQVYDLLLDKSGKIWIVTGDGGLHLYNPQQDNFFKYTNDEKDPMSISENLVRTVYQDRNGIIWLGIYKSGINFFLPNEQNVLHYNKEDRAGGLSANKVKAFCEDFNGDIWVGVDGGGLNKFDKKNNLITPYKSTTDKNSIGSDYILDIYKDNYDSLWISAWAGGLNLLNRKNNTFKHYYHNPNDSTSISSNDVWCMIEDQSRNLWVATYSEGLNMFDRKRDNFKRVPCILNNQKSRIICMAIDHKGYIWVGTNSTGVGVFDPRTKKFVQQFHKTDKVPHSLSSNGIYDIFVDSKNRIWIATDKGLNLYNPATNNFTTWQTKDGLIHDVVVGILEDEKGNLWMSTLGGISKFNPETKTFSNLSMLDDLKKNKFLESACMRTKNGEMYFGGIQGFNVFHPDSIKTNSFIPPVYFTDFKIFNKSVKVGDKDSPLTKPINRTNEITLSYKQSFISFEFVAPSYINLKKIQYAYKLEGFDNEWIYIGNKRNAFYTNLNPGEYILKVKASNDDGVWNEKGATLKIVITPPYYKTWWFRLSSAMLVLVTAYSWYRSRINTIKKQKEELETEVISRTAEVVQQKEELLAINEQINAQSEKVEELYGEIKDSIRAAQIIQLSILPSDSYIKKHLSESFVLFKPKDVVSGDFYWFEVMDDKMVIASVDCTGHGVPGAFMSITGYHLLNTALQQSKELVPSTILQNLNQEVIRMLHSEKDNDDVQDGMDIALCVIDKQKGQLQYAGANNHLYYIRNNELKQVKANGFSIGLTINTDTEPRKFRNNTIDICEGDIFYIFSDGYADQLGGESGNEKFMYSRFRQLFTSIHQLPMEKQKQVLDETLMDWRKKADQLDDVMVIGFKV